MLAAGMFEYNFGDSEFLMLFLLLVTLPYAADARRLAPAAATRRKPPDDDLDALLDRIAGRSILVVGDLMLDHFVYRPRRPDLARSARAGRAVRSRGVPPRRRRERRAQHRRARRPRARRSASSAPTPKPRGCSTSCARCGVDTAGIVSDPAAVHDEKAARRDDAKSAGRADRLRARR